MLLQDPEYSLYDYAYDSLNGLLTQYQVSVEVQQRRAKRDLEYCQWNHERFINGTQLTIYLNKHDDYHMLCCQLNAALHDIPASPPPSSDFSIMKCPHLSIRCDRDDKGEYVSAADTNKYEYKDHPIIQRLVSVADRTPSVAETKSPAASSVPLSSSLVFASLYHLDKMIEDYLAQLEREVVPALSASPPAMAPTPMAAESVPSVSSCRL